MEQRIGEFIQAIAKPTLLPSSVRFDAQRFDRLMFPLPRLMCPAKGDGQQGNHLFDAGVTNQACLFQLEPPSLLRLGTASQYTIPNTAIKLTSSEIAPIVGREALLALVHWLARQPDHDTANTECGLGNDSTATATAPDRPDGSTGLSRSQSHRRGGSQR